MCLSKHISEREMDKYLVLSWSVEYHHEYTLILFFFVRWRTPEELMDAAAAHWKAYRAKDVDLDEDLRDDHFVSNGGPNCPGKKCFRRDHGPHH